MSDNFARQILGLTGMIHSLGRENANYPPHNVIVNGDSGYTIELALAGFTRESISITVDRNILAIEGKHPLLREDTPEYQYRGISARDFTKRFALAEFYEVVDAEFKDGILRINLVRNIPENLKPKEIKLK